MNGGFKVMFEPRARQGVNLTPLAGGDVLEVSGPLADPSVKMKSGNPLEKAASLGTHIATLGGITTEPTLCIPRAQTDPERSE